MKLEDATLKDLIFSLFLMLFFGGAGIFINVIVHHKVGVFLLSIMMIISVGKMLLAIYRKIHDEKNK